MGNELENLFILLAIIAVNVFAAAWLSTPICNWIEWPRTLVGVVVFLGIFIVEYAVIATMAALEQRRRERNPPPRCAQCGTPLVTPQARQCFACGHHWHGKNEA